MLDIKAPTPFLKRTKSMKPLYPLSHPRNKWLTMALFALFAFNFSGAADERRPIPPTDPVVAETTGFRQDLIGKHPRLVFTADDLPGLRAFYHSEAARSYREHVEEYSKVSVAPTREEAEFPGNPTDGQRQGFWRMPTVALHYLMTGEETSKEQAIGYLELLLDLEAWETLGEYNSGMSHANMLAGAALVYDWLYHDLDEDFREAMRLKIREMTRGQYYGGYLRGNPTTPYWQNDPQNNHRWKRATGMALGALVSYSGDPSENYLLYRAAEDLALIARWLPMDGSSHESPSYQVFGGSHLILGISAGDHCLETNFLGLDYYKHMGYFRLLAMTSGLQSPLPYGDNGDFGGYANFFFLAARHHQQDEVVGRLREWLALNPNSAWLGWLSILWEDPQLGRTPPTDFPRIGYFPDVGSTFFHDTWTPDGVSALFRCGPLGGYALNDYRRRIDGTFGGINVAHDDPDANSFVMALGDTLLAETSRYSLAKRSSNHNTVLINGIGQFVEGRDEPQHWSQPGDYDMTRMAYTTGWLHKGGITGIEGEAAGSYPAFKDGDRERPAIDRYRRSFFWVQGDYVLILDEVRSPEPVDVTWMIQSKEVTRVDDEGRVLLSAENKSLPVQLRSNNALLSEIVDSTADHRRTPLGWRQLQSVAKDTASVRFASAYDMWDRKLNVEVLGEGKNRARVIVSGDDFQDEWIWESAPDDDTPSPILGKRLKGPRQSGFPYDFSTADNPDYRGPPVLIR